MLDAFFMVHRDRLALSDTQEYTYYSVKTHHAGVVVIAQTKAGLYVVNEEYRHPAQQVLLSLPCGCLMADETPEGGARRELLEETGYTAKNFATIGTAYPYPGISGQKLYYVAAFEAEKTGQPALEPSEVLTTGLLSPSQLQAQISQGRPVDGNLCTALFFLQNRPGS